MVGRKDFQLKIRGLRVDPGEPELVLRQRPNVADVAVVARRAGEECRDSVAFVVPAHPPGDAALAGILKASLATRLPSQPPSV